MAVKSGKKSAPPPRFPRDLPLAALHAAVESGNADMVGYLLSNGARTDLEDWSGRTALDVADLAPRVPIPQQLAEARVLDPYGAAEVEEDIIAPNIAGGRGGRGGPGGPDAAVMAEIRVMLEEASQGQ